MICSVENCNKGVLCRGWCIMHYGRWRKNGEVGPAASYRLMAREKNCSVEGCLNPVQAKNMCPKHYVRNSKHGNPLIVGTTMIDLSGQRYGHLLVKKFHSTGKRGTKWFVVCDCGSETVVKSGSLRSGKTKSCGCRNGLNNRQYGPNKVRWIYERNAKERGILFELSDEELENMILMSCDYCGSSPSNEIKTKKGTREINFMYNGIDRIDNDKPYQAGNCVPCCKTCNFMKCMMSVDEFLAHIKRIASCNKYF